MSSAKVLYIEEKLGKLVRLVAIPGKDAIWLILLANSGFPSSESLSAFPNRTQPKTRRNVRVVPRHLSEPLPGIGISLPLRSRIPVRRHDDNRALR
jgi:hypothetical protein